MTDREADEMHTVFYESPGNSTMEVALHTLTSPIQSLRRIGGYIGDRVLGDRIEDRKFDYIPQNEADSES